MVDGIFPSVLKKLVSECCDRDPSSTEQDGAVTACVKLNFSEIASNDSEVVKKNIDLNGMWHNNARTFPEVASLYIFKFSLTGKRNGLMHCRV